MVHQEAALVKSVAPRPRSGICEKVKHPPNGSSCSACFLKPTSWQHVRAWQGSMELRLASRESANMENHLVNLHVFVFGRRRYFFLFSLLFLSFLPVTVLVLFWYPFHTLFCSPSFLSVVAPSHFLICFKSYRLVLLFLPYF